MLLSLKILRGMDLAAKDHNLIAADSSDPYCFVFIDEKKIGKTPVQFQTLKPVWGGPFSTYKFRGSIETKVTIQIWDFDNLSSDDPMGKISFSVGEMLKSGKAYPNEWRVVEPLDGCSCSGKLQVRLMQVPEPKNVESPSSKIKNESGDKLLAGPKLKGLSSESIRQIASNAVTPVTLHVYDVGNNPTIKKINNIGEATGSGGIFHAAVEIYGKEFSFGGSRKNITGVFGCPPKGCPMHTYRESIFLGDCELSQQQVIAILDKMKPEWMAPTYDLLRKNCCFFSREFAIELGVGSIPKWVYSLANVGKRIEEMRSGTKNAPLQPNGTSVAEEKKEEERSIEKDLENKTLDDVMASRVQNAFRSSLTKPIEPVNSREYAGSIKGNLSTLSASMNSYGGEGIEIQSK